MALHRPRSRRDTWRKTERTAAVAKLLLQWNRLHICSGRLCRTMTDPMSEDKINQLLLPSSMTKEVLEELHDRMGHQGIDRVEKLVRARF